MAGKIDKWCVMCGAAPGVPCTIISGDPEAGVHPGDPRREPHFYRGSDVKPTLTIAAEPPFYKDRVGTEYDVRVPHWVREYTTALYEAWVVGGREDDWIENVLKSVVLNAYLRGRQDELDEAVVA